MPFPVLAPATIAGLKALAPYVGSGLGFLGGMLGGNAQNKQAEEDRKLAEQQMRAQILQALAGDENDLIQRQGENGLSSTQMDPYAQNRSLSQLLMRRQILGNIRPMNVSVPGDILGSVPQMSGGLELPTGGFDVSALTDSALASGAEAFYKNAANASGGQSAVPNLGAMGLGGPGTSASQTAESYADSVRKAQEIKRAQQRAAIMAALGGKPEPANSWTTGTNPGTAAPRNPWLGSSGAGLRRG